MDLADVMQQLADRLVLVDGFRAVYAEPPESVTAPAAVVSYPDRLVFDETYGRGSDRIPELPIVVVVGKPHQRAARDLLGKFCNGSGPQSLKQVIESGDYSAFDTVRVTEIEFDVVTVGTADYLAAVFTLDIAGPGSGNG